MGTILDIENLSKTYRDKSGTTQALENVSFSVKRGEVFGVIGLSGAGKSTLIRCINMLEKPSAGHIVFYPRAEGEKENPEILSGGIDITTLSERDLRSARKRIAMIFQSFNLFQQRTALDNVMFPMTLLGKEKRGNTIHEILDRETIKAIPETGEKQRAKAMDLLEMVGLADKAHSYPSQLSGGQQQRVAIARALALYPEILLSDESTSALDPATATSILNLLKEINLRLGLTIILITHQMAAIEAICDRVAIIDNSHIVEQGNVTHIFSDPQSDIAKRILFSDRLNMKLADKGVLRIIFDGN